MDGGATRGEALNIEFHNHCPPTSIKTNDTLFFLSRAQNDFGTPENPQFIHQESYLTLF